MRNESWSGAPSARGEALSGGARWGWAPNLLLWAALVAGSACGALAYTWQSRRDLVRRRRGAGAERDRCRNREAEALTANAAWPI
jgi:hypothetical protein